MDIAQLRDKRFYIVLEALVKGLEIPYKHEWNVFLSDGILYQSFYNKDSQKQIIHKSEVTLQSFITFCENLADEQIKEIFGRIRLKDLQDKLTNKGA